uniref:Copper transport protein n=1 Tax=Rhabditophanes sp. KR3021 TaxID=114890 RepID=A0AC35TGL3_9BILA
MDGPMMEMFFHFRIKEAILFKEWMPENVTAYILSCLAVFLLGALFEIIRSSRIILYKKEAKKKPCCMAGVYRADYTNYGATQVPSEELECDCPVPSENVSHTPITSSSETPVNSTSYPINTLILSSKFHYAQTVLSFFQIAGAYSLMMISMTYNVPIFASMCLGHGFGYFLLSPLISVELQEKVGDCCS